MWIAAEPRLRLGDPDLPQKFERARAHHRTGDVVMELQGLAYLGLNRMQRIERGHRLLKDDRNIVAADFANVALRQREHLPSLETDTARRMRCGRIGQQ